MFSKTFTIILLMHFFILDNINIVKKEDIQMDKTKITLALIELASTVVTAFRDVLIAQSK